MRFIRERAAASNGGIVDVHPIAAVTRERKGEHLANLAELAEAGAVAFTDDGDPVHDAEVMRRALEYAAMFGRPIIQHAQEKSLTRNGVMNEGLVSTRLGLPGWPAIAEDIMVARDIRLVEYAGGKYHDGAHEHRRLGGAGACGEAERTCGHLRGHTAPLHAHRRGGERLRYQHQDEPAAPHARR